MKGLNLLFSTVGPRTEYSAFAAATEAQPYAYPDLRDFSHAIWFALVITAARFIFGRLVSPLCQRMLSSKAQQPPDKLRQHCKKLEEEVFVTACGMLLMLFALGALPRNDNCTLTTTEGCFTASWPSTHQIQPRVRLYLLSELGWYIHLVSKPLLGHGVTDGRDMVCHHWGTIALIVLAYSFNLHRIGVLVLSLLSFSNPLLHAAKIANQLQLGRARVQLFAAFALIFLMTRVILFPHLILRSAILQSRFEMPFIVEDFTWLYGLIAIGLVALYALQLQWFAGIARILFKAAYDSGESAGNLACSVDPAKRFAVCDASTPAAKTAYIRVDASSRTIPSPNS